MATATVYDFKQNTVTINTSTIGSIIVTGFGDGDDVLSIASESVNIVQQEGALSDVVTSIQANSMGTIGLTLLTGSPTNTAFTQLAKRNEEFTVSVVSNNDQQINTVGNGCFFEKIPDNGLGKVSGERAWVIKVAQININEGSN